MKTLSKKNPARNCFGDWGKSFLRNDWDRTECLSPAIVDIVRKFMQKERLNFMEALEKAHHRMVFTNHTLVAGGTDLFPRELIKKYLVRASDVWLNIPKKGWEACGTSGMKAAANGVLQWTVPDGWAAEVDWSGKGWVVEEDPNSLYDTLEKEIVPCFYARNTEGVSKGWVNRSERTVEEVRERFNIERMIKEYIEKLYQPALKMSREVKKYAG